MSQESRESGRNPCQPEDWVQGSGAIYQALGFPEVALCVRNLGRWGRGLVFGCSQFLAVDPAVVSGIPQYRLHVLASLGEGDGLHEFSGFLKIPPLGPLEDVSFTGVVGRQCLLPFTAPLI